MIELSLNSLQKYYGANLVLEDITFDIQTGERVGIVGENGCGKSTLLKILMGIEGYDKGVLSIRKGASLGYLEQVPAYDDGHSVLDVLSTAFQKADKVYEQMRTLEYKLSNHPGDGLEKDLDRYSCLQSLYESLGGYEKEERLSRISTGLKMDRDFLEESFSYLSGGEKTTVILGKILLQNPDILLLDEPSNHLDLESMEWLEYYLKEYKGTVVIVSHDRYFLDNVVGKIIEIEGKVSKTYMGNYSQYVIEKDTALQLHLAVFLDQQKKIKSMEKAISQLRDWGSRGDNNKFFRRAASMQSMLDKIEKIDKPILDRNSIRIDSMLAGRSGSDVVIIEGLSKSYGDKVLIKNADLLIKNGESVGLIGSNGCGKTTLLKILLGETACDSGKACLGSSIKLGYLPQNISFGDEKRTVLECFREGIIITEGKAREYLAKYMFFSDSVFKKVVSLSGGEKSRLKLAKLMYFEVNFLVLDEPTNHLDINSREELEGYLKEFQGTLLFVSHDRYFINNIASRVVELSDGGLTSYIGNYEYFKEKKASIKMQAPAPKKPESRQKERCRTSRDTCEIDFKEKTKNDIEKNIEELEEKIKAIDEKMTLCSSNYEKLNDIYNEKLTLKALVDDLMEQYFTL